MSGSSRLITLSDSNRNRDCRIYPDLVPNLVFRAYRLYFQEPLVIELDRMIFALFLTTIDLCLIPLSLVYFRSTKASAILHILLSKRGKVPTTIAISDGKKAYLRVLDDLLPEPRVFFVAITNAGLQLNRLEFRPIELRRKVQLFFKWNKQNMRIKQFFDSYQKAVKTQFWFLINVYVLVAIIRKELRLEPSFSRISKVLRIIVFKQVPLAEINANTRFQ